MTFVHVVCSLRAPGGDDDGSGVLSILGIARTIKDKGIKFKSNVELVAFAGEEQGLLGSRAYSSEPTTCYHYPIARVKPAG